MIPLVAPDENRRSPALHYLPIRDPVPDPAFDRITRLTARMFAVPVAMINVFDDDWQWTKSHSAGIAPAAVPRAAALCAHVLAGTDVLVVPDTLRDPRYATNPLVTGSPGVRFYAGAPLRINSGAPVGTLCLIDMVPRTLTAAETATLVDLAAIVVDELELRAAEMPFRQQMAHALRTSEARLAGIIGSAMDAIITVDAAQRIVVFNAAAEQLLRCPAAEALGTPLARFIPARHRAAHAAHIPAFGRTGATSRTMHALRPLMALRADGVEVPIEATISHVGAGGEQYYTVIIRDITERLRAEQERALLLERAQHARNAAEDAVRVREIFLSIAAHELKTPLTALLGYTFMLQRSAAGRPLPPVEERAVAGIAGQGQRLATLIDSLLDVARIRQGHLLLERGPVELQPMLRRAAAEAGTISERHAISLELCAEPLLVDGDALRLAQVFQNLLSNAIKYSPAGGPIRVVLRPDPQGAAVTVVDQGIGIPAADQPQIFSLFYRAETIDPRRISGLGLGLFLVRQIVSLHGGTIRVESRAGEGSAFTVTLPLSVSAAGATLRC